MNNIVFSISSNFEKMQKIFLYKAALIILGIFTYIALWIRKFFIYSKYKKSNSYKAIYDYADDEIEIKEKEYYLHIEKEIEILGKKISEEDKKERVKKYIEQLKKEINIKSLKRALPILLY